MGLIVKFELYVVRIEIGRLGWKVVFGRFGLVSWNLVGWVWSSLV